MPKCRCYTDFGLEDGLDWETLVEKFVRPENYCTSLRQGAGGFICPNLSKELRRADTEKIHRHHYKKAQRKKNLERQIDPNKLRKKRGSKVPENFQPRRRKSV